MLDDLLARAPGALEVLHAALVFVGGTEARRLLAVAPGTAPADMLKAARAALQAKGGGSC